MYKKLIRELVNVPYVEAFMLSVVGNSGLLNAVKSMVNVFEDSEFASNVVAPLSKLHAFGLSG